MSRRLLAAVAGSWWRCRESIIVIITIITIITMNIIIASRVILAQKASSRYTSATGRATVPCTVLLSLCHLAHFGAC